MAAATSTWSHCASCSKNPPPNETSPELAGRLTASPSHPSAQCGNGGGGGAPPPQHPRRPSPAETVKMYSYQESCLIL
jgi:hypothetical protein